MERTEKDENLIRSSLQISIQRMKGKRGIWGSVDKAVMRLVHMLVYKRMMQTSMDEIDDAITE